MDRNTSHPREHKNKAFISYRHVPRDVAVAKLVQRKLEQFRIPDRIRQASAGKHPAGTAGSSSG